MSENSRVTTPTGSRNGLELSIRKSYVARATTSRRPAIERARRCVERFLGDRTGQHRPPSLPADRGDLLWSTRRLSPERSGTSWRDAVRRVDDLCEDGFDR